MNNKNYEIQVSRKPAMLLYKPLLKKAEIIVKEVPEDYLLSGKEIIVDMFHKFDPKEAIGGPQILYTVTRGKIEHVIQERRGTPCIIVFVHTHPVGIVEPSEMDKEIWLKIYEISREYLKADIYFGIHSTSIELPVSEERPPIVSENRIKWKSYTRWHEIAFFDQYANPIKVGLCEW
ncbi:MAG: hypothetical protein H0Z28_11955 [Archaeoglobus sp.]|nr:hypothetical protein [Archaeoglobus sp.]